MLKISIVGMGFSGTTLVERLKNISQDIQVDIYEKSGKIGVGLAYQKDTQKHLINRPANLMHLNSPGDFCKFLSENGGRSSAGYIPREEFGEFLQHSLLKSFVENPSINIIKTEVTHIELLGTIHRLYLSNGRKSDYDLVILATGNPTPTDYYKLITKNNYFNTPYPANRISSIRSGRVGVLGNQLSAIDAALTILEADDKNQVVLMTRKSRLPNFSAPYTPLELRFLTEKNLKKPKHKKSMLALARDLLDFEFREHKVPFTLKNLFSDHTLALHCSTIYSILAATNVIITMIWFLLTEREKRIFSVRYSRQWRQLRVPIPIENWQKLQKHIKDGRLSCATGLLGVTAKHDSFEAIGKNWKNSFSYIINATGAGDASQDPLFSKLTDSGLCQKNPYGGIKVDFETCQIKSAEPLSKIFAIGAPTIGDFFATSNIDILKHQAEKIKNAVIQILEKAKK